MRDLNIAFIWLALIGLLSGLGYIKDGTGGSLTFAAFGFGFATPVAVGLFALGRVRSSKLGKGMGVFLVGIASAVAAALPPLIMTCSGKFNGGDAGLAVLMVMLLTTGGAALGFAILSLCILLARKTDDNAI